MEIDHSLSTHFTVLFGGKSEISEWLSEQIAVGAEQGEFCAENEFAIGESKVHFRLETLRSDGSLTGFLILVSDGQPLVPEGAALVQRQQWHDIKNMVGGLKLYASYLLRKLPESEDREIIVKMAKGIDSLIDRLDSIRRGEAK